MGKLTGFMEYPRTEPPGREPHARVRDWLEFHEHLPESTLKEQGARCMDCGVPFCHTGTLLAGAGLGLPHQQPDPRVERPRLPRAVA